MIIQRAPVADILATWLATITARPFGSRQPPPQDTETKQLPFPFGIVYAVPGGETSGPGLSAPDEDAQLVFQVNAVALTGNEAEDLMDHVRVAILEREDGKFVLAPPPIPGWVVIDRGLYGGLGDVTRTGAPPKRVFTGSERYVLNVTPDV